MKTLLFIVFKVLEVIAAFVIIGVIAHYIGFFKFIKWISDYSPVLFWILDLGVLFYCLYSLISEGFFQNWFALNREWVNKIIKR